MNVNSEILAALSASSHLASTQQPDDKQISIHLNENHQEEKGRSLLFARSGTTPIDSLTLRILIANDIRHDIRNILKVAQQIGEKNVANERPIQLILLTGNLAQDSKFKNTSLAQTSNAEGEVMSVVARFEQIKRRVYYIPGSTDPQSLYSRNNKRQNYCFSNTSFDAMMKQLSKKCNEEITQLNLAGKPPTDLSEECGLELATAVEKQKDLFNAFQKDYGDGLKKKQRRKKKRNNKKNKKNKNNKKN
jgi:hypothetical protein